MLRNGIAALAIVGLALTIGCTEVEIPTNGTVDGIRTSGTGRVAASPDIAQFSVGVETFNENAQEAVAENNELADAIIAALKDFGVADNDIRTQSFNLFPQRDFERVPGGEVVGFRVTNVVSAKIRDLERVGEALQLAIDAGANTVNGVSFTIEDPTELRDEARVKAIVDATTRAKTMAEAAGVKLGKAESIVETSGGSPPIFRGSFDEASDGGTPIEPGELEIVVSVDVLFEID